MKGLLNKHFLINLLITTIVGFIQIFIIKSTNIPYIPLTTLLLGGVWIGYIEPQRGWILSFWQVFLILLAYFIESNYGDIAIKNSDMAMFVSYVSFFPVLFGSFIVSFVKRM